MSKSKDSFPTTFIPLSLLLLLLFIVFLFIIYPLTFRRSPQQAQLKAADTFYFNNDYNETDPLLTAVPTLDKMITGPIITGLDPSIGASDAPVNIVVYTDFTCWYCGQTIADARQIQRQFPAKVRVVHKDFPSADKTFKSYQAAIAGRCAQAQNKFWEMSNLLYQNYDNLSQVLFNSLTRELKLNQPQFEQCLTNGATTALINDDIKEANALRINGIPTVYVNKQEIMGKVTHEELKQAIEEELKK